MYVRIAPDVPKISETFWYHCAESLPSYDRMCIGAQVRVQFKGRRVRGWILETRSEGPLSSDYGKTIEVDSLAHVIEYVSDGPPEHITDLACALSRRYLTSPVTFLRRASPKRILRSVSYSSHVNREGFSEKLVLVSPRADRREIIKEHMATTGSTVIIAPDSHRKLSSWCSSLGMKTAVYSHETFQESVHDNIVVVGGRNAVFAPITDCESIIVLDDAFEQLTDERSPRDSAVDLARYAATAWGIPITYVSAVPSVATWNGTIDDRRQTAWPDVTIDNKRNHDPAVGIFSHMIVRAISDAHQKGYDAAIIVNNVMNAKLLVCASCATIATCPSCGHPVHDDGGETLPLVCSTCTTRYANVCVSCGSTQFKKYRRGISSLKKDASALFPRARVEEVTTATQNIRTENGPALFVATEALFHRSELVKNLGCCIFIDFDATLLRRGINSFVQACVSVVRAMRSLKHTDVTHPLILSTSVPDNDVIVDMVHGDFVSLRTREASLREQLQFAPFYATAELTSIPVAIDKLVGSLDASVVVGTHDRGEKKSVLLRSTDHNALSNAAYEHVSALRASNRCTLAVDYYE